MDSRKIFVIDTSVVLYDHQALDSFEEHDVAIPITVLEELDQFKKGSSVLNRNAREFIRRLDEFSSDNLLQDWIPLNGSESGRVKVVLPPRDADSQHSHLMGSGSGNDNRILAAALDLKARQAERRVILVSKDINLRLKARALELPAEDYKRIAVTDVDRLYGGKTHLVVDDPVAARPAARRGVAAGRGDLPRRAAGQPLLHPHQRLEVGAGLLQAEPRHARARGEARRLRRRAAQRRADLRADAIIDPEVRLVTLTGPAGTGKTLLALAGALEQQPAVPPDLPGPPDRAASQPRHRLPARRHRARRSTPTCSRCGTT